tara:strand:- start:540 stop:1484 length:945 start_codon:yes stop_codon:yes gene_type:complete
MDEKGTPLCVGLDPTIRELPKPLLDEVTARYGSGFKAAAEALRRFNFAIIDATSDLVPIFKPQSAFYEIYGSEGISALEDTVRYAKSKGAMVTLDAKRNDIGKTSMAYAEAHLGHAMLPDGEIVRSPDDVDLITVNAYLGSDGINPFVEVANRDDKGMFVLVKTSNPSSGELQDLVVEGGEKVYMKMARLVDEWGRENIGESGYSNIGAVVGATFPEQAEELRKIFPNMFFLMPGYGTQGAKAETLVNGFDNNGRGAMVNSSSGIIFAYSKEKFKEVVDEKNFADAARMATIESIKDINSALEKAGKLPDGWRA